MAEGTYHKTWDLEGETVLQWQATLPSFPPSKVEQKRLTPYYEKILECWEYRWNRKLYWSASIDLVEKRENLQLFYPWKASLVGECLDLQEIFHKPYLSVSLTVEEQRGTSRKNCCFFSDMWDYQEGIPLSSAQLSRSHFGKSKEILKKIQDLAEKKEDFLLLPEYEHRIAQYFSPKQLHFTLDGGEFHFPQGSIASKVEGVPKFFIPYGKEHSLKKDKK